MSYEELKNKGEESEILSCEHEKVRGMCGSLKRVNAPTNFDFHLKARITNADKSDFQSNAFLPFLRYALPLSLVLLVAGFVVFSGILTNNQNADLTVVENIQPANSAVVLPATVSENLPSENNSNAVLIATNSDTKKAISNVESVSMTNKITNSSSLPKSNAPGDDFGGTRQSASKDSLIIMPRGIPPTQSLPDNSPVNIKNKSRSSVKKMLQFNGIEADFINSGWSVKGITANTLASRSGVKSGDFIESADNRILDSETISELPKTLYIMREGKRIAVELK